MSTMDFGMMLLEKGNVAVSPGSGFGPAGEGFLRMSLVENEARLRQAVRQIQALPARGGEPTSLQRAGIAAPSAIERSADRARRNSCQRSTNRLVRFSSNPESA